MKKKAEKHQYGKRRAVIIIVVIVVLAAVPIVLFRSVTSNIVDKISQTISLQYSQELNAQMNAHISSTIDYYFHELNLEYNALKLIDNLDEEKLEKFIADTEKDNGTSYIAYADTDGYVYEADGSYLGTMRVSMLGNLLNGENRIITDNVTIGNESYIVFGESFAETVTMGDKTISIGFIGMTNDALSEHLVLRSDYSGGYSSVMHNDGSYVVKNTSETKGGLNVFSILEKNYGIPDFELAEIKSAIKNGETYFFDADSDGAEASEYMYFSPVSGTEWYIVNTLPSSFIKSSIVDLRDTLERVYIAFVILFITVAAIVAIQQTVSSRRLRRSSEKLAQALRVAEEASGAKTSFLFSMSHDIRTPMNVILGYTDIGLNHVDDPEVSRDSYQKIKTAGGHLLNLINDILEMSRIESGKMALSEKPIDIRDAIADTTVMSEALAVKKSIDYKTVIGDIQNPYIYADELHINEVIINIISNAVKYTPAGGRVRYTVSQTAPAEDGKAKFRFEISDNGIGMSREFQKHLFEAFSREETTTISKTEGTGLGLSIVKRIVDMAGGKINVHSVQNEGSTFTVEIPFRVLDRQAAERLAAEKQELVELESDKGFAGKKILLVEDNELNREIATYVLNEAGMEVETAEDGSIAVNAVAQKGPDYYDFILMDIQMPVMNGYEATKKIRELPGGGRIPIIALSANAFEEDRIKSIENGMNAHVAKPIDIKVLLETMHRFV